MAKSKWIWTSVCCQDERHKQSVHSWMAPMVGEKWGLPLKCDIQEHSETGAEGSIRALYRMPDGRLKEVNRKRLARTVSYRLRDASRDILADYHDTQGDV
jgi:hypothetical protein